MIVCVRRCVALVLFALAATTAVAGAHPLGNFTSNHLSRITVDRGAVVVQYVLDDAEIPTFAVLRSLQPSGTPTAAQLNAWGAKEADRLVEQLALQLDGRAAPLHVIASHVALRPGAGGLQTLYLRVTSSAALPPQTRRVVYQDGTFPEKIGWRDVVLGTQSEPTNELRSYPNALLGSPRDRTSVAASVTGEALVAETAAPAAAAIAAVPVGRMNALSDLLDRNVADPLALLAALALAVVLGALHALEPGHGKTLLSISLVGARATAPQAALLAGALTVAHTLGVFAFGLIVLALGAFIVPEALYPWIALASGALVAVVGGRALAREVAQRRSHRDRGHDHDHDHDHAHAHTHTHADAHAHAHDRAHGHGHGHDDDTEHALEHLPPAARGAAPIGFRTALLIAASGNIAPCPAALVVLLAAIATHRLGIGLVLIVAFSLGLAATLTAIGFAVVRGAARLRALPALDRFARIAPLATAAAISLAGAVMVADAFASAGIGVPPALVAVVVLVAIAASALGAHGHRHPIEAAA